MAQVYDPVSGEYVDDSQVSDPSLSSSQLDVSSSTDGSGMSNALGIINALTPLGYSVASAVTGRPLVQTSSGGYVLGQAPTVTGSVNISTVLIFGLIALAIWKLA